MNFGLKDFFVGVIYVFVIFLPGAVVVGTVLYLVPDIGRLVSVIGVSDFSVSLMFFGASYFFGHVVSLLASYLEDKFSSSARRLEQGKELAAMRRLAFDICQRQLRNVPLELTSLRRWAALVVRSEEGSHQINLETKDADRRFFRNIRFVLGGLLIAVAWLSINQESFHILAFLLILVCGTLSHFRYLDQDAKFTKLIFENLIVLDSVNSANETFKSVSLTHAGGVVFRKNGWRPEFLLIRPANASDQWVLPKGHIEEKESPENAAVREVEEEAGVVVEIRDFLGNTQFRADGEEIRMANFLMMCKKEGIGLARVRESKWCAYDEALQILTFPESRTMLSGAQKLV